MAIRGLFIAAFFLFFTSVLAIPVSKRTRDVTGNLFADAVERISHLAVGKGHMAPAFFKYVRGTELYELHRDGFDGLERSWLEEEEEIAGTKHNHFLFFLALHTDKQSQSRDQSRKFFAAACPHLSRILESIRMYLQHASTIELKCMVSYTLHMQHPTLKVSTIDSFCTARILPFLFP